MKKINAYKKIRWVKVWFLLLTLNSFFLLQVNGQDVAFARFYKKIAGTYLDAKTQEIVFIHKGSMFYQPNPYSHQSQVKWMTVLQLDTNRRFVKIKFAGSNYVCEFSFTLDYQKFVCKNPDGSKQTFKRVKSLINKPFSYFVKLFPRHIGTSYHSPTHLKYFKKIPIEIAAHFLSAQGINITGGLIKNAVYDVKNEKHALDQGAFKKLISALGYYEKYTFYIIKSIPVSDQFYTLVFKAKGDIYGENMIDLIYLANFSKNGQLIDLIEFGGEQRSFVGNRKLSGYINKDSVVVNDVGNYLGPEVNANSQPKYNKVIRYQILPTGKIKKTSK